MVTKALKSFTKGAYKNCGIWKIALEKSRKIAENCGKLRKIAEIAVIAENCGKLRTAISPPPPTARTRGE